jgi:pilus assembly protein CpaB
MDSAEERTAMRGAVLRHFLDIGAPVTNADVVRAHDRGFLATVLAPGTRAVTIGVDQVAGVAGLIWPGDLVDVILTQQFDAQTPLSRRVLSETVLTAVRVIAVDQDIVQGGAPVPGASSSAAALAGRPAKTVTLQVGSDEAERLTTAQHLGHLALAVRAVGDAPSVPTQAVVYGGDVSPSLSRLPLPTGSHVQVIEGDKQREVSFP